MVEAGTGATTFFTGFPTIVIFCIFFVFGKMVILVFGGIGAGLGVGAERADLGTNLKTC